MLNVYTKCQKYRQQAESRYRRVAFFMAIADTRLKDSPEGSLPTSSPRESIAGRFRWKSMLTSELVRRPAGRGRAGSLWHGHLNHRATPKPVIITRPCLPRDLRVRVRTQADKPRACTWACARFRALSNRVIQRITRNTRQGRRAEGLCRLVDHLLVAVHRHTPVIVSFEVARRPKSRRRRFLPSQGGSIVRRSDDRWPRLVTQLCLPISLIKPRSRPLKASCATRDPTNSTDWTVLMKRLLLTPA